MLRREANLVDLDIVEREGHCLVVEQVSIVAQLLRTVLLVLLYLLQLYHVVAAVYQRKPLVVVLGEVAPADVQRSHEALAPPAALDLVGVNIAAVLKRALALVVAASLGLRTHRFAPTAALPHDH